MKSLIITTLLSCTLCSAQAGNRYVYGPNGQALGYTFGHYLYDSQTGQEVGYIQNNYLYDSRTGQELGYRSGRYIYITRDGSVLGYLQDNNRDCDE
jgi:hypothetical protein